ncbi:MAG: hypothetical protein NT018_01635 [Armatimonadetes bacterium]|nr:hypothetical protein [Armatimonadota bacterium]
MGDEELVEKWLRGTPDDAADKVKRVLIKYFGDNFEDKHSGGSHQYRVKHPALANLSGFGIGGHLSIPVKNGTKVKGCYLKRIAQAIKYLEEAQLGLD